MQERGLPRENVRRIMKQILPPHTLISDDTKDLMVKCANEFIPFIASE